MWGYRLEFYETILSLLILDVIMASLSDMLFLELIVVRGTLVNYCSLIILLLLSNVSIIVGILLGIILLLFTIIIYALSF